MDPLPWPRLKEEELLEKKISDLHLQIAGTAVAPLIQKLYEELQSKNLIYRPPCFLADEWFCPVGIPVIGIPFYLAHSRLRSLEQKMMLEVEGGAKSEFMRLIRHETGHAYSFAFKLYKKQPWRKYFGRASEEYPETYRPRPYSRSYVLHLENWYAQSHPDEDFAETFAVWLTPGLNWRQKYRGWKALEKLEYIDHVMKGLAGKKAPHQPSFKPAEWSGLNQKLKTYYQKKKKEYAESYPDLYDNDLKIIFTDQPEEKGPQKAFLYLREKHDILLNSVAYWTKEKKYTIDQLMSSLMDRTKELNLYTRHQAADLDMQITAYIASLVTNHLFTGKFKRSK